jgi:hypothetical protein
MTEGRKPRRARGPRVFGKMRRGVDRPREDEQAIMRCSQLERVLDISYRWHVWKSRKNRLRKKARGKLRAMRGNPDR